MTYQKATAEVVLFDNSDVITTSCGNPGQDKGHGCSSTSGDCPGKHSWKESSSDALQAWRAARAER